MTLDEKLRVAAALRDLKVDIIEAGFPAASSGDFESVQTIAQTIEGPTICGLARCNTKDIKRAWDAVKHAQHPRIHVFVATSQIHREHKLQMAKEEIIKAAVESVTLARSLCDDIEFSPEDAARTEPEYLAEVVQAAIEAGATTVNIPDTVAVANSLAAVQAGARQIECTINGIGERAGNCSLEEVVMALRTRKEYFGLETGIETQRLYPTSRIVANVTGMHSPRNKAIVGENAFAHEAGIHQHGMLRHHTTYEIMRPEDVGMSRSNLVLGKHSGRHAFRERVEQLGFPLDDVELNRCFEEFKELADRKKELYDRDIEAIIMNVGVGKAGPWAIEELHITAGTGSIAAAALRISHTDGRELRQAAEGDGPVAAAFRALEQATGVNLVLKNFEVHGVTVGDDAQGEVTVTVEYNDQSYRGHAVSTDIVESAAFAYLEVINRVIRRREATGEVAAMNIALGNP
jgi:2-isopropylmalate synthase